MTEERRDALWDQGIATRREVVGDAYVDASLAGMDDFTDALQDHIDRDTGRVHTSYVQTGASTGRLASTDPNLQNIPVRTEEGRRIRS